MNLDLLLVVLHSLVRIYLLMVVVLLVVVMVEMAVLVVEVMQQLLEDVDINLAVEVV